MSTGVPTPRTSPTQLDWPVRPVGTKSHESNNFMIVVIGLIILIAAIVVGVAGVLGNAGGEHALPHDGFAVFGYHVTGSTGTLFLYGIVVGAVALLGLSLLLVGARRTSRRGSTARHGLKESRSQAVALRKERDDLLDERDTTQGEMRADHVERPSDSS